MPRWSEHPRPWEERIALVTAGIVIDPHAPHFETPPVHLGGIGVATLHGDRTYSYEGHEWGIAYAQGRIRFDRAHAFQRDGFFDIGLTIHRPLVRQPLTARLFLPDGAFVLETTLEYGKDIVNPDLASASYAIDSGWHVPDHPRRSFILFDSGDMATLALYRLAIR